jgi:hypothetical protein
MTLQQADSSSAPMNRLLMDGSPIRATDQQS